MDLPANINLIDKYKYVLADLIRHISNKRCCVFVGAGLSKQANYPLLDPLLDKLKHEAEIVLRSKINDERKNKYERASDYKTILSPEKYREVINKEFNPNNDKQPFLSSHLDIVDLPFNSYITTNYDLLIEHAFLEKGYTPEYSYYPKLPIARLKERLIFHIHGIIDHDNLLKTQDSIILTSDDFAEAYEINSNLSDLLVCLYKEFSMLFVGFNVTDDAFVRILQLGRAKYEKNENIALARNQGPFSNINHFALLAFKTKYKKDLYERDIPSDEIDYASTDSEDSSLLSLGVRTIRYFPDKNNHTQLINILHEMKQIINQLERITPKQDKTYDWDISND